MGAAIGAAWPELAVGDRADRPVTAVSARPLLQETTAIAANNLRLAAALLIAAVAVAWQAAWRPLLDLVAVIVVGGNALAIGLALGAHGGELAGRLEHLPLEAAGIALALSAYLRGRAGIRFGRQLLAVGAGCVVLLGAGALIEAAEGLS